MNSRRARTIRVLHVCASLSPNWGGPVSVITGLVPALTDQGVLSTVVAPMGRRVGTEAVAIKTAEVCVFPTGWLARVWTAYAPGLGAAVREAAASHDLVHIHELWHYPSYAAYKAARHASKPYVVTVHGGMSPWALGHKRLKKWAYMALVQRRILQQASLLHAFTTDEAGQIAAKGIKAPIAVIPNGVHPDDFRNMPPKHHFLQRFPQLDGKQLVLYLGRIHPIKGLDMLASAWETVIRDHPDACLVLAGPDEDAYREKVETLLVTARDRNQVIFTGRLLQSEKMEALAAADIFVLPSYSEGFSMSVLEAMASGLPVIASHQSHFPEVAGAGAGLTVEPNAEQLRAALVQLLSNPHERKEMGRRGRDLVVERYTWRSVSEQMATLYERALENKEVGL